MPKLISDDQLNSVLTVFHFSREDSQATEDTTLTQVAALSGDIPLCPACHTTPHLKVTSSFSSEEWWVTPAGYPPSTWPAFYSWKMRGRAWRTPCRSITGSKCCLPSKVLTLERATSQGTLLPSRGQADSCLLSASSRSKSPNQKSLTKKRGGGGPWVHLSPRKKFHGQFLKPH